MNHCSLLCRERDTLAHLAAHVYSINFWFVYNNILLHAFMVSALELRPIYQDEPPLTLFLRMEHFHCWSTRRSEMILLITILAINLNFHYELNTPMVPE